MTSPLSECYNIRVADGRVCKVPLPFEQDGVQYVVPWMEAVAGCIMQHKTSARDGRAGLQLSPTVHCARWDCLDMDCHVGEPDCFLPEWRMPLDVPGLLEPIDVLHDVGFAHCDIKCANYVQHAAAQNNVDHRMLIDYGLCQPQWGANRVFQPDSLCTASTRAPCLWHVHYGSLYSLRRCDVYAAMCVPLEARVKQCFVTERNPHDVFPEDMEQLCDDHRMGLVESWHGSELNMRMLLGGVTEEPTSVKPLCKAWSLCVRQFSAAKASEIWSEAWEEAGLQDHKHPVSAPAGSQCKVTKPVEPSTQPVQADKGPELLHPAWQTRLADRNMRFAKPTPLHWSVIMTLAEGNSEVWRMQPNKALLAAMLYVLEPNCSSINLTQLYKEGLGTFDMSRVDWEPLMRRSVEGPVAKDPTPFPWDEEVPEITDMNTDDLLKICCH